MEYRRPSSITLEVSRHIHIDNQDGVKILAAEPRWFEQGVREAIHIRMEQPSLNKDRGSYKLPSIWNNVLKSQARGPAPRTED